MTSEGRPGPFKLFMKGGIPAVMTGRVPPRKNRFLLGAVAGGVGGLLAVLLWDAIGGPLALAAALAGGIVIGVFVGWRTGRALKRQRPDQPRP